MFKMKTISSATGKSQDNAHSKCIASTGNIHPCEVIYETETMTSDKGNDSPVNSVNISQNISERRIGETEQQSQHQLSNFTLGNKHLALNKVNIKDKRNSNILKDGKNENEEKNVGYHDDQADIAKNSRKKWKYSVTYNDNTREVINKTVDNSLNGNNYSGSSSTLSSITESSATLKFILMLALILSIVFLLIGYFLNLRYLLITGCILSLTSVGCLVQLCFTTRTSPNKFNPQSVPFALAAEDLPNTTSKTIISPVSIKTQNNSNTTVSANNELSDGNIPNTSSTVHLSGSTNTPVVIGIDHIQARRLSMALQHLTRHSIQPQSTSYNNHGTSSMLNMARRLTMASSAIAMAGSDRDYYGHSSWLTGSRVRHGVRRSLAWNESGATRFYEQCYD
ncbi:unnamed protein product [Heterobilharzia americana]|nr:unnamed protein product [Heterobilharzia americana]CAH8647755.1 unnamed protein product [Heterobilharzia americana]